MRDYIGVFWGIFWGGVDTVFPEHLKILVFVMQKKDNLKKEGRYRQTVNF